MSKFAKLYETDQGQILVKLDAEDGGGAPEVRFYVTPPGLGVCSIALKFKDSDEGWDKAEEAFDIIDEARAIAAVAEVVDMGMDLVGGGE